MGDERYGRVVHARNSKATITTEYPESCKDEILLSMRFCFYILYVYFLMDIFSLGYFNNGNDGKKKERKKESKRRDAERMLPKFFRHFLKFMFEDDARNSMAIHVEWI